MPVWQIVLLATALAFAAFSVFLWIWNVLRAKKMREQGFVETNKNKKVKMPIKLDQFIELFGGIDNIISSAAKNNKIKIYTVEHDKVNFVELKKIKNRGITDHTDHIEMILGTYAVDLSGMVNDLVTLNMANKKAVL